MKRFLIALSVTAAGLLLGGAVAGWPSQVKSDVVIDGTVATSPLLDSTSPAAETLPALPATTPPG